MENDRVNALINQFTMLLEDIFEAEDSFNPKAEMPSEESIALFSKDSLREEKPWLRRKIHRALDFQLRRLGKSTAARDRLAVDTVDLARITGICERALRAAEVVDLKELYDEDNAEEGWATRKLQTVENGILAANVIMLLIVGRGNGQQVPL